MKKILSTILAISLIAVCFAVTAGAAETKINLIGNEDMTYEGIPLPEATDTITHEDKDGVLTVVGASGYPYLKGTLGTALKLDPEKTKIVLEFELDKGETSIRLQSTTLVAESSTEYEQIGLHHYIKDATFNGSGNLATPGKYSVEVKLSDLGFDTSENTYTGKKDLVLNEDGELEIAGIVVFSVSNATVKITKFEFVVEDEGADESSTESEESTSSETSSTSETSSSTTPTGDAGYIALAVIAVVALAGAVVVKKVR